MSYNRQPIFTNAPILTAIITDPPVITDNTQPQTQSPTFLYTCGTSEGELIDRITISSTASPDYPDVSAKLIYLYLYSSYSTGYSLYKTVAIPATTVSSTVPNPEIEISLSGGLVLSYSDSIYIGASTNYGVTGYKGDKISITIEGGKYQSA